MTSRKTGRKLTSERLVACASEGASAALQLSRMREALRDMLIHKHEHSYETLCEGLTQLLILIPEVQALNCQDELNWFRVNKQKILTERNRRRAAKSLRGEEILPDDRSFIHDFPTYVEGSSFDLSRLAPSPTAPSIDYNAPPTPEELEAYARFMGAQPKPPPPEGAELALDIEAEPEE